MSYTKLGASVAAITFGIVILIILLRLFLLSRSLSEYKKYWDNRAANPPSGNNNLQYVALGDSTAQGIGATRPEKGYVGLIAKYLEDKYNRPVHVINLSKSGATISQLTEQQLPELKKITLAPDAVVTIGIGANDLANFHAETFLRQTNELFAQLPPRTIVAELPYFGGGRRKDRDNNAQIASGIIGKAAARYGLRVAPLYEITKSNDGLKVYGADLFHPSNAGYKNWYLAFVKALES